MPPLRRKPIRSSTSRATAAATTAPATQTVSEASSTPTAVRPVPPATLSLADALPEEPTPAMLLEEEALSSETSGSSEGSLLSTLEELEEEEPVTPTRPSKPSYTNSSSSKSISQRRNSVVPSEARRWDQTSSHRSSQPAISRKAAAAAAEPAHVSQLRAKIFPTLYAIFQQSRGGQDALKIRNRTLRSLTKSCLYHREEAKLERTLSDAEALFEKYCARQRQNAGKGSARSTFASPASTLRPSASPTLCKKATVCASASPRATATAATAMETAPSSLPTTAARLLSKFAACAAILLLTLFFSTFCVSCTTARSLSPQTSPRVQFMSEIEGDSESHSGSGDSDDEDNDLYLSTETPDDGFLGGIVINNQIGPKTLALGYLYAAGQLVFLAIIIIILILYYRRYVLATALIVQRQMWSSEAFVRQTFAATIQVPARNPAVTPCNCSCKFEEMVFYYTTSGFMVLVGVILLLTALVRLANWIVDQMESRSSRRTPPPLPPLDYVGPCAEDHIYDEPHHGRVPELGQYMQMK